MAGRYRRMELQKLEHPEQIDFVYAHNDMMAIAAREYFMAWDSIRGRELRIIGVDAWRVPVWKPWKMDGSMPLSSIRQEGSK